MPAQHIERVSQLLTATGGATGILTVTSTTGYANKAVVWLRGLAGSPAAQLCKIVKVVDATHVKVVFIPEGINDVKHIPFPNYGTSDCSGFAIGSQLQQMPQVVDNS